MYRKAGMRPVLAGIITLLTLVMPGPLHAASKVCSSLLTAPDYDLELPVIGPVRDQCGGTCWLSAGLTLVEHSVHAQSGQEISLSEDYLIAMELKHQALSLAVNGEGAAPLLQGRTFPHVEYLIREYGLVPKSEFSAPHADWTQVSEALRAATEPYLRKKRVSEADLLTLGKELDAALDSLLAPLPKSFRVAGRRYTPMTFGGSFIPRRSFKTLFLKEKNVPDPLELHHSLRDVLAQVKASLEGGKACYASIRWPEEWHSAEDGLLNLDPKLAASLRSSGLHAVAIVGAKVDARGTISALKIQNSWGNQRGDAGFYHISRKALEQVLQYVVIANGT